MSELKDVPQLPNLGLINLPKPIQVEKCQVILSRGKRIGEICGEKTYGQEKCSAHANADKRKYGSNNPFMKAMLNQEVKENKPFEIIDDEEEEENEFPQPEEQPLVQQEQETDDVEEIVISLKNVKAVCFKIVRPK